MKKKIIGLCAVLILASGCGKVPTLENGQEAIVSFENGEMISVDDFYNKIKNSFGLQTLITMVDTYVLETEFADYKDTAKESGDAYVDAYIESYGGEEELLAQLQQIGYQTIDAYRDYWYLSMLQSHAIEEYAKKTGIINFIKRDEKGKGKNGGVYHWVAPSNSTLRTTNWTDIEVSQIIKEINLPFSNPKNKILIEELIKLTEFTATDTILDFFSGSATTAHAVMQLNAEDGGKRKFIMVQLPEKTDEKSEAFKAGYKNICEIGKERIRRAGEKVKQEAGLNGADLDIGFRVFKLDSTNVNDVYYSAGEYDQQMLQGMESNIKADRTDMDLLFGCLLDWGLPLSLPYTSEMIDGFAVHTYNDGDLIACFAENLSEKVIEEIAQRQPFRAVFRDSSFVDSPAKINVWEKFKLLAPDTQVKVI